MESDDTHQKWSTLTTAPTVGPAATTGSASGGETADGTDNHNDSDGSERDTKTTYPGYAYSAMSAASSTRVRHDQYDDKVSWNQTESAGGAVATSGSGSFKVSGNHTTSGQDKWAWTQTTSDASASGSGSGAGSGSTTGSNGGTSWATGGSYSTSVDYWGFYQGEGAQPSAASVYFTSGEGWVGPGSPMTGTASGSEGLDTGAGASELEPGLAGGVVPGDVTIGPPSDVAAGAPVSESIKPVPDPKTSPFVGGLQSAVAMADQAAAKPSAGQQPAQAAQVKAGAEAKAATFNGVTKRPDLFGGEGLPFSNSRGPVSIVGIAGGGVHPRHETGGFDERKLEEAAEFADSGFSDLFAWISRNKLKKGDREVHVDDKTKIAEDSPQIYGSTDKFPITDNNGKVHTTQPSKSVEDIAQEQLKLITDTIGMDGAGLKKDEQAYRLLIVGHSWGGDKAIQVVNRVGELLNKAPQLKSLYDTDRIQIHLITLDAIEQGKATPSKRKLEQGVHVESWLNLSQIGDSGVGILMGLRGSNDADFDGENSKVVDAEMLNRHITVPGETPPRGWHAFLPKAARWHIERYF